MPNDDITIVSSTDSAEEVQAALTGVPVEEKPAPAVAATPAEPAPVVPPAAAAADPVEPGAEQPAAANETPEQKLERERGNSRARRTNRIQSDIDKLTWQKGEAKRLADAEEARVTALRAETAALEAKKLALAATPAAAAPASGTVAPKMDDVDANGRALYPEYEDFVNANGKWHAEQAAAAVRTAQAESEERLTKKQTDAERDRIAREAVTRVEQEAYASYDSKLEAFRSSTPDFDATYDAAKEFVTELVEERGPSVMNVVERYTVHDADNGPAVTHFLCKNPDEMRWITALPVPQQIAALAKIDARLAAAPLVPAQPPAAPVTRAPEPIKPVGSTPTASSVSPEDESYPVYKARRAREEAIARGATGPA